MAKRKTTMTPTNVTDNARTAETKVVKHSLFNLNTFTRESKEKEIELPGKVDTMEQVLKALDNDESRIVSMYNMLAVREAIKTAKQSMGGDGLVSPKIISGLIAGFAVKFPLKDDTKASKKLQRNQMEEYVRSQPALLEALKIMAIDQQAAATDDDEDENESDEG